MTPSMAMSGLVGGVVGWAAGAAGCAAGATGAADLVGAGAVAGWRVRAMAETAAMPRSSAAASRPGAREPRRGACLSPLLEDPQHPPPPPPPPPQQLEPMCVSVCDGGGYPCGAGMLQVVSVRDCAEGVRRLSELWLFWMRANVLRWKIVGPRGRRISGRSPPAEAGGNHRAPKRRRTRPTLHAG